MFRKGGKQSIYIALFFVCFLSVLLVAFAFAASRPSSEGVVYGATFSMKYARHLGLDAGAAYLAVLDDLGARVIRIPVYWSEVERVEGQYDFSEIDWMMNEAEKRGAQVTLVTGLKVPRWPECHVPDWAMMNSSQDMREDILRLVQTTVERYRDHPALARWQVENEPFFPFGLCPSVDAGRIYAEFDLVKSLDSQHPIVRTTSGEQSIWLTNAPKADVLGVTLYRVVYSSLQGYWVFPIPPVFYAAQAAIVRPFVDDVTVIELQAEPWLASRSIQDTGESQLALFDGNDLRKNVRYAQRTGMKEILFWGVEWWYYLKELGEDELWMTGKAYFDSN